MQKLLSHGLLSLLDREVQSAAEVVKKGNKLIESQDVRIQPYLPYLSSKIQMLSKKIKAVEKFCKAHRKDIAKDAHIEKTWGKFNLPISILKKHADCARFLVKSGLIYSIIGYRETSRNAGMHDVQLDKDGHPLLRVQGHWTRWEHLKDRLFFDEDNREIVSKEGEDQHIQKWNYFNQGLTPIDRLHYDTVFPIYELSEQEYHRLVEHAGQFYHAENRHLDPDPHASKPCIVQFVTSPLTHKTDGFHRNVPAHVSMRLITHDRKVYSFGIEMPYSESKKMTPHLSKRALLSNLFCTTKAQIGMLDFTEFSDHSGRNVTSMPLTAERAQNILDRLNALNAQGPLRFNYGQQNCTSLMLEVMKAAGHDEVDVSTPAWEVIAECLNPMQLVYKIPMIGPAIRKVATVISRIWDTIVSWTPQCIRTVFSWADSIIFYIPRKIGTVVFSLIIWKMGAGRCTASDQEIQEEDLGKKGIKSFSTVIRSWTDIFKQQTVMVNHSKKFLDWQRKQRTTHTFEYTGRPSLCIVPPVNTNPKK